MACSRLLETSWVTTMRSVCPSCPPSCSSSLTETLASARTFLTLASTPQPEGDGVSDERLGPGHSAQRLDGGRGGLGAPLVGWTGRPKDRRQVCPRTASCEGHELALDPADQRARGRAGRAAFAQVPIHGLAAGQPLKPGPKRG